MGSWRPTSTASYRLSPPRDRAWHRRSPHLTSPSVSDMVQIIADFPAAIRAEKGGVISASGKANWQQGAVRCSCATCHDRRTGRQSRTVRTDETAHLPRAGADALFHSSGRRKMYGSLASGNVILGSISQNKIKIEGPVAAARRAELLGGC